MAIEYRLLGPLEVLVDGRPAPLGPPRHRGALVVLLAHRLIDEMSREAPPAS